jgi:hypothetical protein
MEEEAKTCRPYVSLPTAAWMSKAIPLDIGCSFAQQQKHRNQAAQESCAEAKAVKCYLPHSSLPLPVEYRSCHKATAGPIDAIMRHKIQRVSLA